MDRRARVLVVVTVACLALVSPAGARPGAPEAGGASAGPSAGATASPATRLYVDQLLAPSTQNPTGRDMPTYLGHAQRTVTQRATSQRTVSNVVRVPRAQWSPGRGADEWDWGLGLASGTIAASPELAWADELLLWSDSRGGSGAVGATRSLVEARFTSFDSYQQPHVPTGIAGSLGWRSRPGWRGVLSAPSNTTVNGTPVQRIEMYTDHAQVQATGGDIDASDGDVPGETHTFVEPVPPGTVMNLRGIAYGVTGPWRDTLDLEPDWDTDGVDPVTSTYRLNVGVTLRAGGFLPRRVDDPGTASPQHVVGVTFTGIPLVGRPEDPTTVEAKVRPGETQVLDLAIRQPDGSDVRQRLRLEQPGHYRWRVAGGRLVRVLAPVVSPLISGATPAPGATPATQERRSPPPAGGALPEARAATAVGPAGVPVLSGVALEGQPFVEQVVVRRVDTAAGPVDLDTERLVGAPVAWANPSGTRAVTAAVYHVEGALAHVRQELAGALSVQVRLIAPGEVPRDWAFRTQATLAPPVSVVDPLSGPVAPGTVLGAAALRPRLEAHSGGARYTLEPTDDAAARSSLHGRTLELVRPVSGQSEWAPVLRTTALTQPWAGPRAGTFTAARVYRLPAAVTVGRVTVAPGGGPPQQTRDLDGRDTFAVAFSAAHADSTPVTAAEVQGLYLALTTADGTLLYRGTVVPDFSAEAGQVWGVSLRALAEIPPADVEIYARAAVEGGVIATEASTAVPPADWTFAIDRAPLTAAGGAGGTITGTTVPLASVTAAVPELGLYASTTAAASGAFTVDLDLADAPSGDYEATVTAVAPGERDAEATAGPSLPQDGDVVPDDEVGVTTVRIRHARTAAAAGVAGPVNRAAAIDFLAGRAIGGAYDSALRPTSLAVAGLRAAGREPASDVPAYLATLAAGRGTYAWSPGGPATAAATALAQGVRADSEGWTAGDRLLDLLTARGGAVALPDTPALSTEATGLIVAALDAAGVLPHLDPYARDRLHALLSGAPARSAAEAYARIRALQLLGGSPAVAVSGSDTDAVAYRALLDPTTDAAADLTGRQRADGGLGFSAAGGPSEAAPTALALLALSR